MSLTRQLHVYVHNQAVATLESIDGFRHVMAYHPGIVPEQFVSLLMPVRTESYVYPELHPFFHMNLPEGYLLSILQEELGPHVGASPLNLLSVVGRNGIGRVKIAPVGADPTSPPAAFELAEVLRGDNSEQAFEQLVRRHATSGVSGVVPKFLSPETSNTNQSHAFSKTSLATERFIIKGGTARLPGVAINEHLCMEVARRAGIPTALTELSDDGLALIVHRFDIAPDGITRKGMEDLCSLLLLRPEQKYESTWERVANRIKDAIPNAAQQQAALSQLADLILLSYALRNADCHTKNVALLYSDRQHIELAPVYDMLSVTVYDDYNKNPPSMSIEGRYAWLPGKALERFLQTRCGIYPADTEQRVMRICQAIVEVSPDIATYSEQYPFFQEIGMRMRYAWNEGMNSLRLQKQWQLPTLAQSGTSLPELQKAISTKAEKIGLSPLLRKR